MDGVKGSFEEFLPEVYLSGRSEFYQREGGAMSTEFLGIVLEKILEHTIKSKSMWGAITAGVFIIACILAAFFSMQSGNTIVMFFFLACASAIAFTRMRHAQKDK